MKVGGAWKLAVSKRSLLLVIPLCVLLLASMVGNVRQYHRTERQRQRAVAAERKAAAKTAHTEAEVERAKLKRQSALASSARIDQLYQEINNLTQMSERVLLRDRSLPTTPAVTNSTEEITSAP